MSTFAIRKATCPDCPMRQVWEATGPHHHAHLATWRKAMARVAEWIKAEQADQA